MKALIYLFCAVMVVFSGCSGKSDDPRLLEIAEKVSACPEEMMERIDSMDAGSMKESDRWLHALLRIKAQDKAYVVHTSDSVILRVIDYYSRHKGSGHYPEALYYGGRVYSDIGDAPTALRYFQAALEALPEGKNDNLRSRIYSQMGSLLNSLRLYKEAGSFIKEVIGIEMADGDSINLMRNIQLLGSVYMHSKDYDLADSCFRNAREIAVGISHSDTVIHDMYMSGTELYRGNIREALKRIRVVLKNLSGKHRDIVYAYASQIYLAAGISDTAYLFAEKLIRSKNNDHRRVGYGMLLSPELRKYSSPDSLFSYSSTYGVVLNEYLDRHDAEQATIQTSLYNYQTHEHGRKKAEEAKRTYMYVAGGAMLLILLLGIVVMYLNNKNMKNRLLYHEALDDMELLKKKYSVSSETVSQVKEDDLIDASEQELPTEIRSSGEGELRKSMDDGKKFALREQLKEELLALQKAGEARKEVDESILSSSAYGRLKEYLDAEKRIPDSDGLWGDLEEEVLKVSPRFRSGLYLLAGERLKDDAYHMALLIKCGMTPTELTVLAGRSKGAVSSRRGYICEMIFGKKLGAKVMDDIIRLL
ncbi:MAG: hypothetical protein K2M83_10960 [Muribaculaceae bacterium]|nr:hypothetical protein [Muribaculaceae bacterium]